MRRRSSGFNCKPAALFMAPEPPYPMAGGGALRSASVLEFLTREYEVDAIFFRQGGAFSADPAPPGSVRDQLIVDLPHHSRRPLARAVRNAVRLVRHVPPLLDRFSGFAEQIAKFLEGRRYDLGVIEHFWCAPYLATLAPHCRTTVLDLHNIESAWHGRSAQVSRGPQAHAHRVFRNASAGLEREWLPRFSLLLTTSVEDAARVQALAPAAKVAVYPNAIPLRPQPQVAEEDSIVFSGSLDYEPNRAAVRHFRDRIWPALRWRWPSLRWRLVGRNAHAVRRLVQGDSRIECSGAVDDAVAELARSKVAVVPLLAGSGTRFKIIEAWAAGRAVVSTTLGAEGLIASPGGNILIEDEPELFAGAVSSLLESPAERVRLGTGGRETYERAFTWQAAWAGLERELSRGERSAAAASGIR